MVETQGLTSEELTEGHGDLRVFFAGQRTMLAWVRTGVALMGFGFVVARFGIFLKETAAVHGVETAGRGGASVWAGTGLLLAGVAVNVVAGVRFARFAREFGRNKPLKPTGIAAEITLAAVLAGIGVALAVYLTVVD